MFWSWLPYLRLGLEKIFNAAIYYVIWLVCIFFAAANNEKWALVISLILFTIHFSISKVRKKDFILMMTTIFLGFIADSFYIWMGMISYSSPNYVNEAFSPVWILLIWAVFGLTLNHSMWWLKNRYVLSALLGSWGGAVSYAAGERLGACQFLWSYQTTMTVIGMSWFFLLPCIVWWASWVDRHVKNTHLTSPSEP